MLAAIGSITLLLTDVLPQFVPLFEQNGAALPRSTQLLIDLGHVVSAYGLWVLLLLLVAGVLGWQVLQRPAPRLSADRLLLRLPLIGVLAREVLAARFTRTLGTLLTNGVPLITALGIVAEAVGNRAGTAAVEEASRSAKGGAGLSAPAGPIGRDAGPNHLPAPPRRGDRLARPNGVARRRHPRGDHPPGRQPPRLAAGARHHHRHGCRYRPASSPPSCSPCSA